MEGFEEEYLQILELIDDLSSSLLEEDDMLKSKEDILQKLARLNSKVDCVSVGVDAGDQTVSATVEEIQFARQKIELAYRRFRNAQVVASHRRSEQWLKRRGELLRPASQKSTAFSPVEQTKKPVLGDFNPAVSKSEDITATLRRVHQMAQGEVLKGELNIEELDSSTKALKDLENKYSAVDMLLNGSKRLVQVLEEADKGDRRRIQLSLGFLAAVLCWVVYRRVLKLPLKILFWNIVNVTRLGKWAAGLTRRSDTGHRKASLSIETILSTQKSLADTLMDSSADFIPQTTAAQTAEVEGHIHTEISGSDPELVTSTGMPSFENEMSAATEHWDAETAAEAEAEPTVLQTAMETEEPIEFLETFVQQLLTTEQPDQDKVYSMETQYYAYEEDLPEETIMPTTGTVYYAPEDTLIKNEL